MQYQIGRINKKNLFKNPEGIKEFIIAKSCLGIIFATPLKRALLKHYLI